MRINTYLDDQYTEKRDNRKDRWHQRAVDASQSRNDDLCITWPIVTEACYLLRLRLNVTTQLRFLREVKQKVELFLPQRSHLSRCHESMKKYADLSMDLADASLVIAAEELGEGLILSTDQRDFNAYR